MTDQVPGCPYCGGEAEWVENKAVYGRNYGKSYMMWLCRPCGAYVGCHNNTREPLGTLADSETRKARSRAHAVVDPLWKSKKYSRGTVYRRLSMAIGEQVHIGESSVERCEEIIKIAKELARTVPVYATKPEEK